MKKSPLQQLITELRKAPIKHSAALELIENLEISLKEKQFLEDVFDAGYNSKSCFDDGPIGDPCIIEVQAFTLTDYLKNK